MSVGLYKITDVMQVPLKLDGQNVSGEMQMHFNGALNSLSLPFTIRARKLYNNEQQGVLYHIKKNLWVLVAYNTLHGATSLFVIDSSRLPIPGVLTEAFIDNTNTLKETVVGLGDALVKAFARRDRGEWEEFKV